jgi:hypothetical protein
LLSSLTLADAVGVDITIHDDDPVSQRVISAAKGLVGITAVRESKRSRPQAHGWINEAKWTDGKTIQLAGECWAVTEELALEEFRAITEPMLQTLDNGPALMKWQEGVAGNALQSTVKLASSVEPSFTEGESYGRLVLWDAVFESEDPRAYSQELTTVTGNVLSTSTGGWVFPEPFNITFVPSSGGLAAINLAGNRPTPPIFRIYGYCSSPILQPLGDTSKRIVCTGEISAGDYLEIDVARRTARINGAGNASDLIGFAATTWFEIPTGPQTVQLLASAFDATARVDVLAHAAYA